MYGGMAVDEQSTKAGEQHIKEVGDKTHCTAFCPICGSDLYIMPTQCVCKNKNCNWRCKGCASEDDV